MKWSDIAPADAVDIDCRKRPDLEPPLNEAQEACSWPWDPQQLTGYAIGQYHCPYCGAMVIGGLQHLDYRVRAMAKTCHGCGTGWQGTNIGPEPCPQCGELC
jgi:hypothetical protein